MIGIIHQNLQPQLLLDLLKKEKEKDKDSKANAQPSTEYCSVRMRIIYFMILENVDSWYDENLKL